MTDDLGYNLYDFTARQYDMQIGRFWGVDPASQFPSGYTGMGNDPANKIDPSGCYANGAPFAGNNNVEMGNDGEGRYSDLFGMSEELSVDNLSSQADALSKQFAQQLAALMAIARQSWSSGAGDGGSVSSTSETSFGGAPGASSFSTNMSSSAGYGSGNQYGPETLQYMKQTGQLPSGTQYDYSIDGLIFNTSYDASSGTTYMSAADGGDYTVKASRYPGIDVYQANSMSPMDGVTLPPVGIFVGSGASGDQNLTDHEYGHFLQYQEMGALAYYTKVAIPSIYNTTENKFENFRYGKLRYSVQHSVYQSETDANSRVIGGKDNDHVGPGRAAK